MGNVGRRDRVRPVPLATGVLLLLFSAGCGSGADGGPATPGFQPEITELQAFTPDLDGCRAECEDCLAILSAPGATPPEQDDAVARLHLVSAEFTETDRSIGHVIDRVMFAHQRGADARLPPVSTALDELRSVADDTSRAVDDFLDSAVPNLTPPEHLSAVNNMRASLEKAVVLQKIEFFRNFIPIRFVQFFVNSDHIVSDERLQESIDVANEVFLPARIRFQMVDNNNLASWQFHDLDGGTGSYTWPDDLTQAPPLKGITYPDPPSCPTFVRPVANTESKDMAQMRAGTYCCPDGEILVYINQGRSTGGQYPWYSRIVGMSSGHMATPGVPDARYVFAHELGHYFGLPHTFGDHLGYFIDYSLARMVDHPVEGLPPLDQRRYYTTHANLLNPETDATAPLSLFWDMVFKPNYGGVPQPHTFFNSRAEAAAFEGELQPIEDWEWGTVRVCQPSTTCCGGRSSSALRLEHTVAEGFRGAEGDVSDPGSSVEVHCTGDHPVRAFSRPGTVPHRIQVNIMSYEYRLDDASTSGARVPGNMIDGMFISQSQIEQIHRVLEYDCLSMHFALQRGRRPELGSCIKCHPRSD